MARSLSRHVRPDAPRRERTAPDDRAEQSPGPAGRGEPEEAARYIAAMTGELAAMASMHRLAILAYLLDVARLEASGIAGGQ